MEIIGKLAMGTDQWNIGFRDKNPLWGFYSITNYVGAIGCFVLWLSIIVSRKKKTTDIYIAALAFGCMTMSIPCATQCFLNWLADQERFEYGEVACLAEAYFHVTAIQFQFFSVALIAKSYHETIVEKKDERESIGKAYVKVGICWVVCYLGTFILAQFSEMLLLDAGAYCFYYFTSPVMFGLDFLLVVSASLIIHWYRHIYIYTKKSMMRAPDQNVLINKLATRLTIYILILVVGWSSALVVTIYVWITGSTSKIGDTIVGVFGSLHSVAVPAVYGYHSENLKKFLVRLGCCKKCLPEYVISIRRDDADKYTVIKISVPSVQAMVPSPILTNRSLSHTLSPPGNMVNLGSGSPRWSRNEALVLARREPLPGLINSSYPPSPPLSPSQ